MMGRGASSFCSETCPPLYLPASIVPLAWRTGVSSKKIHCRIPLTYKRLGRCNDRNCVCLILLYWRRTTSQIIQLEGSLVFLLLKRIRTTPVPGRAMDGFFGHSCVFSQTLFPGMSCLPDARKVTFVLSVECHYREVVV